MIVLPTRLMTTAPRGTATSLTRATAVRCPTLMSSSASVTGGPPEPSMSVAPSSATTPFPDVVHAARVTAHTPHTGDTAIRPYARSRFRVRARVVVEDLPAVAALLQQ